MKALILAAGRGTRVQPITYTVPKPMIPIINRPVMEFLVDLLRLHGVRQIMVNTSYLSNEIESYFRDGSRFDVEIGYSFEGRLEDGKLIDEPVGSAGAIRKIHDHSGFFDEPFFVLCGDAIIDLDMTAFARFHQERAALASLAAMRVPKEAVSSYGIVVSDDSGRIEGFQEKPKPEDARSDLANTGIYLFQPEVLDLIPSRVTYDIGGQLFPDLVRRGLPFYAANIPFQWLDIGQVGDYCQVLHRTMMGGTPGFTFPGRELAPGIRVGPNVSFHPERCTVKPPVWIGASATIHDGATLLGPCYIGPGAEVLPGAHVEDSFVFDYTRVGSLAMLKGNVASGRYCVNGQGANVDVAQTELDWILSDARGPHGPMLELESLLADILDSGPPSGGLPSTE